MLHEILMHLWNDLDYGKEIQILEMKEYLHRGELDLLEKIISNVSSYRIFMQFCKKIQKLNIPNDSNNSEEVESEEQEENDSNLRGLYVEAFANGISSVLQDYKNDIMKLEDELLQNPQLTLTYIVTKLSKYQTTFELLMSMLDLLQKEKVHGCLLLGKLHLLTGSGIKCLEIPSKKIVNGFRAIFYSQLCNWIIYGDLVDKHGEFFICDGECADEDFLYPEQLNESSHISTSGVTDLLKKLRIQKPPIVRKFYINWKMVPPFINADTAESILFMGRIVWILKNDPRKNEDRYQIKTKKEIWDGADIEYYKKVQVFEKKQFDDQEFKHTIEECRVKITKHLWSIMLDEANLKEHLHLIRDYYALGRGELFYQFLRAAEEHISNMSLDHNLRNLNNIFAETSRKIYGDHDKSHLKFLLTASNVETKSNPLLRLKLSFNISWPLHIVFHPKSIELYNKLFTYLLRLSQTQINLQKLWWLHTSSKEKIDARVWSLRHRLTFLINNLQYFLQVDVIGSQFSLLLKEVENAREFGDILKVHHQFISNLLAKTFVLTPDESQTDQSSKYQLHHVPAVQFNVPSKVSNVIVRLLNLCDEFCSFATNWSTELTEPDIVEVEKFEKKMQTTAECLFFILSMHYQKTKEQYLVNLMDQLDFNKFFSKTKKDFNISASA